MACDPAGRIRHAGLLLSGLHVLTTVKLRLGLQNNYGVVEEQNKIKNELEKIPVIQ